MRAAVAFRAITLLAALSAWSCGGASASGKASNEPATSEPALHRGALTDFVPAAGLRWLIAGSPQALAREPTLAELRQRWLTDERVRAFATTTGVDLLRTERALIAGFDLGTLYMADASGWVAPPERLFVERLAGTERQSPSDPRITRVSGLVGSEPQALVRVGDELVAVAVRDVTLARVVELYARERLQRAAPAFDGASLSRLPVALRGPLPFAFYLLGPIEEEWVGDGTGLLANAQALCATLEPRGEQLGLELVLAGHWDPERDREQLGSAWLELTRTTLGQRLALDTAPPASVEGSEGLLTLRTQLAAHAFAAGLASLLVGNVDDLLGSSSSTPEGQRARKNPDLAR